MIAHSMFNFTGGKNGVKKDFDPEGSWNKVLREYVKCVNPNEELEF